MKIKLSVFLTVVLVLGLLGTIVTSAETPETDETFQDTVQQWLDTSVNAPRVVYTYDSVRSSGVTAEPYADALTQTIGVQIYTDLDFGTRIYDDPDTEEIDGIRVNGATVKSLKIPFEEIPETIVVDVRVDYKPGIVGDLAQMSDGTYDWSKLLTNPIALFAGIYYIIATAVLIGSSITALISKSKKVKTASEIAEAVTTQATNSLGELSTFVQGYLDNQIAPILNTFVNTSQQIVKAVTLSNSKLKEAPNALLDVLKEVSNTDVSALIDQAKQSVLESDKQLMERRANVGAMLSNLAKQSPTELLEALDNETKQQSGTQQNNQQSIF